MPPIDPQHWLYQRTSRAWFDAAQREFSGAPAAFASGNRRAALALCRRAAGMAVNAGLATRAPPDERYGRSYMDHLRYLARDDSEAPAALREAAARLVYAAMPGNAEGIVPLRTRSEEESLLEATRTLLAQGLAMVLKAEPADEASIATRDAAAVSDEG